MLIVFVTKWRFTGPWLIKNNMVQFQFQLPSFQAVSFLFHPVDLVGNKSVISKKPKTDMRSSTFRSPIDIKEDSNWQAPRSEEETSSSLDWTQRLRESFYRRLFLKKGVFFVLGKWGEEPPIQISNWKMMIAKIASCCCCCCCCCCSHILKRDSFQTQWLPFFGSQYLTIRLWLGRFLFPSKHISDHCARRRRTEEFQYSWATATKPWHDIQLNWVVYRDPGSFVMAY